jgi:hypothetical protein
MSASNAIDTEREIGRAVKERIAELRTSTVYVRFSGCFELDALEAIVLAVTERRNG